MIGADVVGDICRLVLITVRRYRTPKTLSNGEYKKVGWGKHEKKRCPQTILIFCLNLKEVSGESQRMISTLTHRRRKVVIPIRDLGGYNLIFLKVDDDEQ